MCVMYSIHDVLYVHSVLLCMISTPNLDFHHVYTLNVYNTACRHVGAPKARRKITCLDRKRKGGGRHHAFVENGTNSQPPYRHHDHIRTCFVYGGGVMPGWRAGLGVGKYTVQCREPKTGHQKVQLYSFTKTIHVAHLCILFIYGTAQPLVVWLFVSRDKHMDFKNVD